MKLRKYICEHCNEKGHLPKVCKAEIEKKKYLVDIYDMDKDGSKDIVEIFNINVDIYISEMVPPITLSAFINNRKI